MNNSDIHTELMSTVGDMLEDALTQVEQRTRSQSQFNTPMSLEKASEAMKAKINKQSKMDYQLLSLLSGVSYGTVHKVVNDPTSGTVKSLLSILDTLDLELVIREK